MQESKWTAMGPLPGWWIAPVIVMIGATATGCHWDGYRRPELAAGEVTHAESTGDDRTRTFVHESAGARMTTPRGWEPTASRDFALMLVPSKSSAQSAGSATSLRWGEHFISLDVPKLPTFRIPGFLPMGRIRGGYLDHLRKQAPDARVEDLKSPPIPDANAALVRTAWPGDHPTHVETALILTHADRVYILRGRSRTEDEYTTRAAFDQLVQSLRWGEN